jgi:HAD superfamily hydrolase (TIGR01549 family)
VTLQGALLDIDGTFVLSNDIQAQAWVDAFHAYGYNASFEQIRPLIGMGGDQIVERIVPAFTSEEGTGQAIATRRKELILNQYAANIAAANGSRELVLKMQESGLRLVVASSATSEELNTLLRVAHVDDLLQESITADQVQNSKPAPDVVEAALDKVHMQPSEVIMLGDTPYDIEAATKAGVEVIAFRCGGFSDQELSGAIAIYDDPADLLQQYERSPLAQSNLSSNLSTPESLQTTAQLPSAGNTSASPSFNQRNWLPSQVSAYLDAFSSSFDRFLQNNRRSLLNIAFIIGIAIVLKVVLSILGSLNDIPLLEPLFELIGLGYVVWFCNRYLFQASRRQALLQQLEALKRDITG